MCFLSFSSHVSKLQKKLKLVKVDYRKFLGLHSFYLFFTPKRFLKIDFNYYPYQRIEKRGYIFEKLLMDAKAKFDWHIDPIQLGTQLIKAVEVKDYPRMLKKIDHREWKSFFINEAKKLKKEIFK